MKDTAFEKHNVSKNDRRANCFARFWGLRKSVHEEQRVYVYGGKAINLSAMSRLIPEICNLSCLLGNRSCKFNKKILNVLWNTLLTIKQKCYGHILSSYRWVSFISYISKEMIEEKLARLHVKPNHSEYNRKSYHEQWFGLRSFEDYWKLQHVFSYCILYVRNCK